MVAGALARVTSVSYRGSAEPHAPPPQQLLILIRQHRRGLLALLIGLQVVTFDRPRMA